MFSHLKNSLAGKVTVKSAVNPSLWACVVISLPCLGFMLKTSGWVQVAFFIIALLPIASFIFSYIFLIFKNPDYLRSEEYQLKAECLKLLGNKDNPLSAEADDVVSMINNPKLPPPQNE